MNYHDCPVCGYEKMFRPPACGYICPCCGTEFEVDDDELSHAELREMWVAAGMQWFSRAILPLVNWDPVEQLRRAGLWSELHTPSSQKVEPVRFGNARAVTISVGGSAGLRAQNVRLNYLSVQSGVSVS